MSSAMKVSEFMLHLAKTLIDIKKVAESTSNAYIRSLYILNDKAPFKTLTFLKDTEGISKKIATYAENTQKALYSTITSVLSLYKDKPTYKTAYTYYHDKMMGKAKDMKEAGADTSEKTAKEKQNWIDWKDVQERSTALRTEVDKFINQKHITPEQFNVLIHYVVLSLYTEVQPRRNQDYLDMYVVKRWNAEMPTDKNYLDLATKHFIFNKYKTQKKYGQQKLPIPEPLFKVIQMYIKHHPLVKGNKTKTTEYRFLVSADGSPLVAVNAITRILNRVFGKKVGSSMLRHSFLSSKYDIKEMETDANAMGHSVEEQKKYLRGSGESVVIPMLEG